MVHGYSTRDMGKGSISGVMVTGNNKVSLLLIMQCMGIMIDKHNERAMII